MTRLPGARSLCKNGGGDAKRRREKARIEVEIPRQKLLEMYEKLLLARFVDDKLYELNTTGVFTGWLHLAAGEEAMPVAVGAALRKDDYLKPQGRGAHGNVAKGMPLVNVFAGMMGRRVEGGGRRGLSFEYGFLGGSTSLGEDVPIYVGAALSMKLQKKDRIAVIFFGDGTSNRAPVHESMNLAAIWKLPVVFVCYNNQYAISLHWSKAIAASSIADRALGYGMPGIQVDGNDVIACYETAKAAVERARAGEGPSLIEARTYRLRGHWEGDPETYRTKDEVLEAKRRHPVALYRESLVRMGALGEEEASSMAARLKAEVDEAVRTVQAMPRRDPQATKRRLLGGTAAEG